MPTPEHAPFAPRERPGHTPHRYPLTQPAGRKCPTCGTTMRIASAEQRRFHETRNRGAPFSNYSVEVAYTHAYALCETCDVTWYGWTWDDNGPENARAFQKWWPA